MTQLAERMNQIDSSGIRKVFALAANLENPCNLSIGQPDFDVPPEVQTAAIEALSKGQNRYTQTGGITALKDRVRAKLESKRTISEDGVLITSGTSGGILLSFMALFDPGDEVLVPDPYFVMYKHLLNLIGAEPVYLDTYPDFQLTAAQVEDAVTPRTKALLLNNPTNPTGALLPRAELEAIAAVARRNNLLVITDEIYDLFVYDEEFASFGDLYENTLLLGGFSKTYAMTGWRLGYAVGPAELVKAMEELQQYTFVCAPSVGQAMGVAALDLDMQPHVDAYRRKRDIIYEGLKDTYEVQRPGGAFYMFPAAPDGNGAEFCKQAIEHNLLVVPGNVFSEQNTHFRISFAASDAELERGVEILKSLAG